MKHKRTNTDGIRICVRREIRLWPMGLVSYYNSFLKSAQKTWLTLNTLKPIGWALKNEMHLILNNVHLAAFAQPPIYTASIFPASLGHF